MPSADHRHLISGLIWGFLMVATARAWDNEPWGRTASWQPPSWSTVQGWVTAWRETQTLTPAQQAAWDQVVASGRDDRPADNLMRIVELLRIGDPRVEALVQRCERTWQPSNPPPAAVWEDEQLPAWARANLRLYYATWLAHEQLFDELQHVIGSVEIDQVADPAALLFFQSVAHHRALAREECLATITRLLENETQLPARYTALAELMRADVEPLKTDSLDEVARLMDNIQVRLGHARAGKRVRTDEESVIQKLDKMIERLEKDAQAAAANGQGNAGKSSAPSQPMQDSMPAELKGPGNVSPKSLGTKTDWGNLPPKEREEALQRLGKDLPSHYREVIEEYFRKLAREKE